MLWLRGNVGSGCRDLRHLLRRPCHSFDRRCERPPRSGIGQHYLQQRTHLHVVLTPLHYLEAVPSSADKQLKVPDRLYKKVARISAGAITTIPRCCSRYNGSTMVSPQCFDFDSTGFRKKDLSFALEFAASSPLGTCAGAKLQMRLPQSRPDCCPPQIPPLQCSPPQSASPAHQAHMCLNYNEPVYGAVV